MQIDGLHLQDFRNYTVQSLTFDAGCNVIFGENAEGKTNLLEAIVYLSCGRSPRARTDRELIRFDAGSARIVGDIQSRQRDFKVDITLQRGQRRKMAVNGVTAKNAAALSDVFQTVFFCPDDLYLIREGAAARRKFLDTALCQLRPRYAMVLSEYNKAYEHKTRILRDSEEYPDLLSMLPEFSERLVQCGAILIHYRARYVQRLAEYAAANHAECSGGKEQLDIGYQTVSSVTDPTAQPREIFPQLLAHQESHRSAEIASRQCLSGPHKDDLEILIDDQLAIQENILSDFSTEADQ